MNVPSIDYSARDFETIKAALIASVQAKFPSTYRDFTESSMGMMLLELVAFCFDSLSYMLDAYCNEQFLPTAKDRESVILLGRLVGYNLRPATSASVKVRATLSSLSSYDVMIPAGTEVISVNGVRFESLSNQIIPAGSMSAEMIFHQGYTVVDEFISGGTSFQEFKLSVAPLVLGSLKVTVDGFEWDKVDSLVYSTGVDDSWSLRIDTNDYGYVKFGDGVSGRIPPVGSRILCSYRIGGGVVGNIPIGDIDTNVPGILVGTVPQATVDVSLYNTERGSGGEDRESIDHAKFFIPRYCIANSRAVTEQDFDTLGSLFNDPEAGAPAYVKCALKQRVPELNTVMCWVWGRDEQGRIAPPSANLKDAISRYFNNNDKGAVRIITVDVEVADGNILYIDINADVVPNGLVPDSEVLINVNNALTAFFDSPSNQPGTDVRLSKLYSAIQSSAGVEHSLIREVAASYFKREVIAVSDGRTTTYSYAAQNQCRPGTVTIKSGNLIVTDNGEGRLVGDVGPLAVNKIDYDQGAMVFDLSSAPNFGEEIVLEYRYPLLYQRSEVGILPTNSIDKTFKGKLYYAPLAPNTVAITDGFQTVTDDGLGRLKGDVDQTKPAVVNYTTGAFEFTFLSPPGADKKISACYMQVLRINSGDIPVDKNQLAVKGTFNIGLLR